MAVYKYTGTVKQREEFTETGTVLAGSEDEARRKLKSLRYEEIRLKKLSGFQALLKKFAVDVK